MSLLTRLAVLSCVLNGITVVANASETLPGHGSWGIQIEDGGRYMVIDTLPDAAMFALLHDHGQDGLMLQAPDWHLTAGQTVEIQMSVDGQIFTGTALALDATTVGIDQLDQTIIDAFYGGQSAQITAGGHSWELTPLSDAGLTRADAEARLRQ